MRQSSHHACLQSTWRGNKASRNQEKECVMLKDGTHARATTELSAKDAHLDHLGLSPDEIYQNLYGWDQVLFLRF